MPIREEAKKNPGPSTRPDTTISLSTGSSGATYSSTTTDDDLEFEATQDETRETNVVDYLFKILNFMPMRHMTLKEICKEWGLDVTNNWDHIDLERKKLIKVSYIQSG